MFFRHTLYFFNLIPLNKKADSIYADVDVVSIDDDLAPVDVIVVTAITFFDEIEENLLFEKCAKYLMYCL